MCNLTKYPLTKQVLVLFFVRYNHVKSVIKIYKIEFPYNQLGTIIILNQISFIIGLIATLGITIVGNFQVIKTYNAFLEYNVSIINKTKDAPEVHLTGAVFGKLKIN